MLNALLILEDSMSTKMSVSLAAQTCFRVHKDTA